MKILKCFKGIIVLVVVICMLISLVSCQQASQKSVTGVEQEAANEAKSSRSLPEKLANPNISILYYSEPGDALVEVSKKFEEKYSGKVTFISTTYAGMESKLVTAISAGDQPDLTPWSQTRMPIYAIKGLLEPIDSLIDINDAIWNKDVMDQFKWKGQHYGVCTGVKARYVYFNQTLFENNGLKTPLELYKEDRWNWNTFKDAAVKLTQDTDRNGTIDLFGAAIGNPVELLVSNGADLVKIKDDGSIALTLNDANVMDTLQFFQDAWVKDKCVLQGQGGKYQAFAEGKLAMFDESHAFIEAEFLKDVKYAWDIVPYPVGPNGKKGIVPGNSPFWGIVNGAKNPEGGIAWIHMNVLMGKDDREKELVERFTPQQIQLINETEKGVVLDKFRGVGGSMVNKANAMWNDLKKGIPVATVIEKHTPKLQEEIDLVLKGAN